MKPDWKVHDKRYSFYVGDPLKFDCSLTQPWINVSLWHKVNDNSPYKVLIPGGNLRQSNQTFKIDSVTIHDNGDYQCQAANINPRTIFVHVLTGK